MAAAATSGKALAVLFHCALSGLLPIQPNCHHHQRQLQQFQVVIEMQEQQKHLLVWQQHKHVLEQPKHVSFICITPAYQHVVCKP